MRTLHPLLPKNYSEAELRSWLQANAAEEFTDQKKEFFSPETLAEFEHESSVNGREINRLMDIKKLVTSLVAKGNMGEDAKEVTIVIPVTNGTKYLETFRRQNDDFIERGYELVETKVFGIPSPELGTMEYFDVLGDHIVERSRPLSTKEKREHLGTFNLDKSNLRVSDTNGDVANEDGEYLGNVSNG